MNSSPSFTTADRHADFNLRSGLKKVLINFDPTYEKMMQLYNQDESDWRIRGGIVGIFSKLCVDSLLRNKLFEKGESSNWTFTQLNNGYI